MSDLGWYGRTWYDRRQNQELDRISSRLESQRSEARRLTAKLSEVQGDLHHRLNRLTTAFDAFVELSDLREELRGFHAEVAARQRARRALARLVAGRPVEAVEPPDASDDTPGYWLPDAHAGLVATVAGDTAVAEDRLTEARELDALRTDLFLCLGLLLAGRVEPATVQLRRLLDFRADRPVLRAQRELWLAAVAGRFGPVGAAMVADGLATLVRGLSDDARTAEIARWRPLVDGLPVDAAFVTGFRQRAEPPADLVAPILAARRLAALADWYGKAVALPDAAAGDTDAEAEDDGADDPLAGLLRALVDEGAPDEQPLLARVAELRKVIESNGGGGAPSPSRWRAELDPPLALVLADARSVDPARRAVAVRAATPLLVAVADDLRTAAGQPVPDRAEVPIGRQRIRFGSMGADPATVASAKAATLREQSPPSATGVQAGWALVAAAVVVLLGGMLLVGPGLGVTLGALVAGIGAWSLGHARRVQASEDYAQQHRRSDWARIEEQITTVEATLADLRSLAQKAADDATAARRTLDEHMLTSGAAGTIVR